MPELLQPVRRGVASGAGINQAGGKCVQIVHVVAGGERIGRIGGASRQRATGAVPKIRLDGRSLRHSGKPRPAFRGPKLLRAVQLAQVADACGLLRFEARADEIGNGDGGQEADDGDHDHDFDEGERADAIDFMFHKLLFGPSVIIARRSLSARSHKASAAWFSDQADGKSYHGNYGMQIPTITEPDCRGNSTEPSAE